MAVAFWGYPLLLRRYHRSLQIFLAGLWLSCFCPICIMNMPALVYGLQRPFNCSGRNGKGMATPAAARSLWTCGQSVCHAHIYNHTSGQRLCRFFAERSLPAKAQAFRRVLLGMPLPLSHSVSPLLGNVFGKTIQNGYRRKSSCRIDSNTSRKFKPSFKNISQTKLGRFHFQKGAGTKPILRTIRSTPIS